MPGTLTRWVDWLDVLVPYAVLGLAASALHAARTDVGTWRVFGVGAVAYAGGHGIHLAANSIYNATPSETAHLWDEAVGHLLWYAGAAIVVASLAPAMAREPATRGVAAHALALAVGITWATNASGGDGTAWPGVAVAVALAGYGWRHRATLARLLTVAYVVSAVLLVGLVVGG